MGVPVGSSEKKCVLRTRSLGQKGWTLELNTIFLAGRISIFLITSMIEHELRVIFLPF